MRPATYHWRFSADPQFMSTISYLRSAERTISDSVTVNGARTPDESVAGART